MLTTGAFISIRYIVATIETSVNLTSSQISLGETDPRLGTVCIIFERRDWNPPCDSTSAIIFSALSFLEFRASKCLNPANILKGSFALHFVTVYFFCEHPVLR